MKLALIAILVVLIGVLIFVAGMAVTAVAAALFAQ